MNQDAHWIHKLETTLRSFERKPRNVDETMTSLNAAMGSETAVRLLASNPYLFQYRRAYMKAALDPFVENEIRQARQLLQQGCTDAAVLEGDANNAAEVNYRRSTSMFDVFDFEKCRRFVMVGSGWLPNTLIRVSRKTQVPELIGLDVVEDAVATARALLRQFGCSRIRIEQQNGCDFDYAGAQIVYVVAMATDKPAMLSRIADTAPDDVQVVVREGYGLGRLKFDAIEEMLDERLEIICKGPGTEAYLTRDVFLRRRMRGRAPGG